MRGEEKSVIKGDASLRRVTVQWEGRSERRGEERKRVKKSRSPESSEKRGEREREPRQKVIKCFCSRNGFTDKRAVDWLRHWPQRLIHQGEEWERLQWGSMHEMMSSTNAASRGERGERMKKKKKKKEKRVRVKRDEDEQWVTSGSCVLISQANWIQIISKWKSFFFKIALSPECYKWTAGKECTRWEAREERRAVNLTFESERWPSSVMRQ